MATRKDRPRREATPSSDKAASADFLNAASDIFEAGSVQTPGLAIADIGVFVKQNAPANAPALPACAPPHGARGNGCENQAVLTGPVKTAVLNPPKKSRCLPLEG